MSGDAIRAAASVLVPRGVPAVLACLIVPALVAELQTPSPDANIGLGLLLLWARSSARPSA